MTTYTSLNLRLFICSLQLKFSFQRSRCWFQTDPHPFMHLLWGMTCVSCMDEAAFPLFLLHFSQPSLELSSLGVKWGPSSWPIVWQRRNKKTRSEKTRRTGASTRQIGCITFPRFSSRVGLQHPDNLDDGWTPLRLFRRRRSFFVQSDVYVLVLVSRLTSSPFSPTLLSCFAMGMAR